MAKEKEAKTYYLGTGRRKTAVARVRISDGKGGIQINGRPLENYFTEDKDRAAVRGPLVATDLGNRLDVTVKAQGGGITGQAGAIRHGIARALVEFNEELRRPMRKAGFLTRDEIEVHLLMPQGVDQPPEAWSALLGNAVAPQQACDVIRAVRRAA